MIPSAQSASLGPPGPPVKPADAVTAVRQIELLRANIERAIIGKSSVVELTMVALLARGHLLIADVPGVGKTTLAQTLARSIDGTFQRIQFTNDLLPSDVVGVSIFDPTSREFTFRPGPLFANVVVADEINRTTPKTQSCLLEAMSDGQVSLDDRTRPLPTPFLVLATQNPVEFAGTYPLPESQLDRFLMRLEIGYPRPDDERRLLLDHARQGDRPVVPAVLSIADVLSLQEAAARVRVSEPVADYIVALADRSRRDEGLSLGISPRGSLALLRAAQALALVRGRDHVWPDDVKSLAVSVTAHRVVARGLSSGRLADPNLAAAVISRLLAEVPVPL